MFSKRQPLNYQHKIHLPITFPKKKEKRTLTNVLKETTTIPPIQDSLTGHFQEDPRVQVREPFLQKRKKNECLLHSFLKRNPHHLKPTFPRSNPREDP